MQATQQVTLIEVGPRDGFQAEPKAIPSDLKVEIIDSLVRAGIEAIQVTSFVHPEWVPQMADAEEVCRRIARQPGVTFSGLALNSKGVARAHAAGLSAVDLSISTSDTHSRRNSGMSLDAAMLQMGEMTALARRLGLRVRAGLQCVFGCAYEGAVPSARVLQMTESILAMGVDVISYADSTGMANPRGIRQLLAQLFPMTGDIPLVLHLHDTRGLGLVNVMAGLESGVTRFDTALAGMGGCPFIPGAAGNIATEDTAYMLDALGLRTGIDIEKISQCSRRLEAFLEKQFPGKMHHILVPQ